MKFTLRDLLGLMHRVRSDSLLRNSVYIMATTVVTSVLGYPYWIMAARIYSPHDVGLAASLVSAMSLASAFANVGIGTTLVQELPQRVSSREWSVTLNAGLVAGSILSLITGAVAIGIMKQSSGQFDALADNPSYAIPFILCILLWTVSTLLDYAYVAERAAGNMLVRNTVFSVVKIPLLVVPFLMGLGALGIFMSWFLGTVLGAVFGVGALFRLRSRYRVTFHGVLHAVRPLFSSLIGNHLISTASLAPMYILPVMVTAMLSATDNAYFYTTWRLAGVFFLVSPAVATALVAEGSHSMHGMARKVRDSLITIAALLVPAMIVFSFAGGRIMGVFGPSYPSHGTVLLLILMVSAVPDAVTNVYVSVLRVRRRLREGAILNIGMAVLALGLALVLLRPLGIAGAGWAWLIAQTVGSIGVGIHLLVDRGRPAGATPVEEPADPLPARTQLEA